MKTFRRRSGSLQSAGSSQEADADGSPQRKLRSQSPAQPARIPARPLLPEVSPSPQKRPADTLGEASPTKTQKTIQTPISPKDARTPPSGAGRTKPDPFKFPDDSPDAKPVPQRRKAIVKPAPAPVPALCPESPDPPPDSSAAGVKQARRALAAVRVTAGVENAAPQLVHTSSAPPKASQGEQARDPQPMEVDDTQPPQAEVAGSSPSLNKSFGRRPSRLSTASPAEAPPDAAPPPGRRKALQADNMTTEDSSKLQAGSKAGRISSVPNRPLTEAPAGPSIAAPQHEAPAAQPPTAAKGLPQLPARPAGLSQPRPSMAALLPRVGPAAVKQRAPSPASGSAPAAGAPKLRRAVSLEAPAAPGAQGSKPTVRFAREGRASGGAAAAVVRGAVAAGVPAVAGGVVGATGSQQGMQGPAALSPAFGGPRESGFLAWTRQGGASVGAQRGRSVQSVAEAQENGEALALQDEASYALDGLRPQCSLGQQRESLVVLAELLATRRGRAALRSEDLTQQVLSRTAQLPQVAQDPALSLAAATVLLSLSQADAHAGYLATEPALRLAQLLVQAEDLPAEVVQLALGQGTGAAAGGAVGEADRAMLARALKLVKEGPLARQFQPLLGLAGSPLQRVSLLVLLALISATATDASKLHHTEETKALMSKVGLVDTLAQCVCRCTQRLHLQAAPSAQDQAAAAGGGLLSSPSAAAWDADRCRAVQGTLTELKLLLQVLENATFTCEGNERALLQCQVEVPSATASACEEQDVMKYLLHCLGQVSSLYTACCTPQPVDTLGSSATGSHQTGPGKQPSIAGTSGSSSSQQEAVKAASGQVLQAGLGLLMNVTHNHADARDKLVEGGGMPLVLQLVACCAAATHAPGPAPHAAVQPGQPGAPLSQPATQPSQGGNTSGRICVGVGEGGGAQGGTVATPVRANRQHVIGHMELLTVCLGVLINTISTSAPARKALRDVQMVLDTPTASESAPATQRSLVADSTRGQDSAVASGCGALDMLCGVLSAVMPQQSTQPAAGQPSQQAAAGPSSGGGAVPAARTGDDQLAQAAGSLSTDAPACGSPPQEARRFTRGRGAGSGRAALASGSQPSSLPADTAAAAAAAAAGTACDQADRSQSGSPPEAAEGAQMEAGASGEGDAVQVGQRRLSSTVSEDHLVTESQLQVQKDDGEASIVQVYVSMLLGFMIQDCPDSQQHVRQQLPGNSLGPLVSSVSHMLQFYVRAGAITDNSRDALVQLLQVLAPLVAEEGSQPLQVADTKPELVPL